MGWPPGWLEVPAAALPLPAGTGGDFSLPRPHAAGPAGHVEALPIHCLARVPLPAFFLYASNLCSSHWVLFSLLPPEDAEEG